MNSPANLDFGNTYSNIREIGSGGGGTVYRAYHARLQKDVALKKIHGNLTNVNTRTETDILKGLKHECLPQVYDFIENEEGVFTVMEYIEGKSLKDLLDEGRRFSEKEVISWFKQLCRALSVLHHKNPPIIHGDIKPANIMLTPEGKICLIDFNIASIFAGTKTIISGYTPGYAAPEQMEYYDRMISKVRAGGNTGIPAQTDRTELLDVTEKLEETAPLGMNAVEKTELLAENFAPAEQNVYQNNADVYSDTGVLRSIVDSRTDIFSLGATIYHLLSGRRARKGNDPIPNIRDVAPNISEPLAHIIERCMAHDPNMRYQDIDEVYIALENLYQSNDRYRQLIKRQTAARVVYIAGLAVSVLVTFFGFRRLRQERAMEYQSYIEKEQDCADLGNEKGLERAFEAAVSVFPADPDAYIIKARYLLENRRYEEAEDFLINIAIPYVNDASGVANLNLILANCFMDDKDFKNAMICLEDALEADDSNPNVYRDYAVCLARTGNMNKADRELDKAIDLGLSEDGLDFTKGEIAFALEDYDSAEEHFMECLDADDSYMRLRAYMMLFDVCDARGRDYDNLIKKLELAKQAVDKVDDSGRMTVLDALAQANMDLGDITNDPSYNEAAIEILEQIIAGGYDRYSTHRNIAVLYQKNGQFDKEYEQLTGMLDKFPETYHRDIYKYLAFVEAYKQDSLPQGERDYGEFDSYYNKAEELYLNEKRDGDTDPEMLALENIYDQIKNGGWLR